MVLKIKCQVSENALGFSFFFFFFFLKLRNIELSLTEESNFALVYKKAKKFSFFIKLDKTDNPSPLPT